MKTPKDVARDCLFSNTVPFMTRDALDNIAAAITAEHQRADALAEALGELLERVDPYETMHAGLDNACEAARAALAAYDAEAK